MVSPVMRVLLVSGLLGSASAWADPPTPHLVEGLRHGGYVLVMRHASSPAALPDKRSADPENVAQERQLDVKGRTAAANMGSAFKALHIPVGEIFSSPTYRARETIRLAGFGVPKTVPELGDQGHSMKRLKGPGPADWLRGAVTHMPKSDANTLIVTHMPNIAAAFPGDARDLQDGEAILFKPDGHGQTIVVAKVPIDDWLGAVSSK